MEQQQQQPQQRPVKTVRTVTQDGVYIVQGCLLPSGPAQPGPQQFAVANTQNSIDIYDAARLIHLRSLSGMHNATITDVVTCPATGLLFSAQADTGVMITDLRVAPSSQGAAGGGGGGQHFLTELQRTGAACSSIAVNSTGVTLAVAADGFVHLVDTRQWKTTRCLDLHTDEISKLLFCHGTGGDAVTADGGILMSAGEDMMTNFSNASSGVNDKDLILSAANIGECVTRATYFGPGTSVGGSNGLVATVGSCENAYLFPLPGQGDEQFPNETKIERSDFTTYRVDWVATHKPAEFAPQDPATAGPGQLHDLTLLTAQHGYALEDYQPPAEPTEEELAQGAVVNEDLGPKMPLNPYHFSSYTPNPYRTSATSAVHRGQVRLAFNVGQNPAEDGMYLTAGEDGVVALWDTRNNGSNGNSNNNRGAGAGGGSRERVLPKDMPSAGMLRHR